jgi:Undecaprenyl-phosphate galactose phosphotransferase WbaP
MLTPLLQKIMKHSKIWLISLTFVVIDIIFIFASFYLATLFRTVIDVPLNLAPVSWNTVINMAELAILFIVGIFILQGLYPGYGLTAVKELERMSKAISMGFILLTTLSFLIKSFQIFPRSIILMTWLICLLLLPITRFLTRNILSRLPIYGVSVVIFGNGPWAMNVTSSLTRVRRLGWKPYNNQPYKELGQSKNNHYSNIAILAFEKGISITKKIRELSRHFSKVVVVEDTNNYGSLWVEIRDLDSFMGVEYQYHLLSKTNTFIKQTIDFVAAFVLLIVLSPLLLLSCLLIRLDSNGPIFYRQERLGRNYKMINIYKFRSMVPDAEVKLQELLDKDPVSNERYKIYHKLEHDPRVTNIGRFLRRFSIDEFPQLINVLKGEMSLSGPRAYLPSELSEMGDYADTILRVNPGMTGWWQVLGRHNTSFQKRLQMDEYYISNWSIWMDIYIFLKTIGVLIYGKGA